MTRPTARSVRAAAAGVAFGMAMVAIAVLTACTVWFAFLLVLIVMLGVPAQAANGLATVAGLLGAGLVLVAGLGRHSRKRNGGGGS
jgi:hypothetical protein